MPPRYGSSGGSSSSGLAASGLAGLGAAYPLLHQRSSSSLSLAGLAGTAAISPHAQASSLLPHGAHGVAPRPGSRRNPSLPGSPSRDRSTETPILAGLNGPSAKRCAPFLFSPRSPQACRRPHGVQPRANPQRIDKHLSRRYSQGQSAVSPGSHDRYDYHTAQLERFLEEYRTLHSELSKMKETCDSLSANPKSILKKKAAGGAQAGVGALSPDHPYWVPRSGLAGLARRYSGGDFYPS